MNISEKLLEDFDLMEFLLETASRGHIISLYVGEESISITIQDPEFLEEESNKDIYIKSGEELAKENIEQTEEEVRLQPHNICGVQDKVYKTFMQEPVAGRFIVTTQNNSTRSNVSSNDGIGSGDAQNVTKSVPVDMTIM